MGSSPSYESQQNNQGVSVKKIRKSNQYVKESLRSSRNRQKQGQVDEINPEHKEAKGQGRNEEEGKEIQRPFTPFQPQKQEELNLQNKRPSGIHRNTPQPNYQELAKSNIPQKKATTTKQQDEQQPQQEEQQINTPSQANSKGKQRYHQPIKGREHPIKNHKVDSQEQTPRLHEHHKLRNYVKATVHNQVDNSSTVKKSHGRNEEIDYHEYDSAHIRHKAIQEIHQQEHPVHIIKHKEPIYQHEKLYPKILNNFHKDRDNGVDEHRNNSNNRHIEHEYEYNVDEEYYEQPHKPHLYKRLRIPMTNRTQEYEEQQQEQQQHKPHPKGLRKEEHNLQKSVEVRAANYQQIHDLKKSLNVKAKIQPSDNVKRRKGSISQDEEQPQEQIPKNANFRKRKPEENIAQAKRQLEQFQQKSIADLNKQNEFNVTEFNVDPLELVTCRQGCGRKFQADRIQKHESICRKVFQQKRKEFNAQQQRIVSKEQKKLLKKGMAQGQKNIKRHLIPKWKAQSIALRAHIKMGMDEKYTPNEEQMEMLSQEQHIDVVNCPYCGRNFNKNSAKTHVPFCKGKYEKQMEKERFQKPIKTRR